MTPKRGGRYLGYPRVSRKGERQDDRFRSPEFQADAIRRYAETEGVTVEMLPPEIDVSGSRASRPILDGAVERVKAGEAAGIIVAKLDRLSRMTPKDRVLLFEEVEQAGGVILSASEQLDPSTPEGRFARDVFLGVARLQWEKYRDGFETAKEASIAAGIPIMTRPPIGYRQRKDRRLEPDPKTAPIIREAFEAAARGGGPAAIARLFEQHGLLSTQGSSSWTRQAAQAVIRSRVYLGELTYGKDDRYVNLAAHEPLVDVATWTAAQAPKRGVQAPRTSNPYLLAGIARCAACGYILQGTTSGRGQRFYRCTRKHPGGVCPDPVSAVPTKIEPAAIEAFWGLTANLAAQASRKPAVDRRALEEAYERAARRFEQVQAPEAQDALGDAWAATAKTRRLERDAAAQALADAEIGDEPLPDVVTLREAWERMGTADRRGLLAVRFDAVALRRVGGDLVLHVWPKGSVDFDLPFRGFKRKPRLCPFPDEPPADVRAFAL